MSAGSTSRRQFIRLHGLATEGVAVFVTFVLARLG